MAQELTELGQKLQNLQEVVKQLLQKASPLEVMVKSDKEVKALQAALKSLLQSLNELLGLKLSECRENEYEALVEAERVRGGALMFSYQLDSLSTSPDLGVLAFAMGDAVESISRMFSLKAIECTRLSFCGELRAFKLILSQATPSVE